MSDGGKGSTRRPQTVADEQFAARWDLIFAREQYQQVEQWPVLTDPAEIRETFEKMEDES